MAFASPSAGRRHLSPGRRASTTSSMPMDRGAAVSSSISTRVRRSAAARGWTNASGASDSVRHRASGRVPRLQLHATRRQQPSLLTHSEVVTMFHEFGHGLHHMLTRVDYPSIAGINGVAWDAVELPSQFMENFAWRPEVLPLISAHVETGEPLPQQELAASARVAHVPGGNADGSAAGIRAVRPAHPQRERPQRSAASCERWQKSARRSLS